ncbi:MAG: hypothetical protein ACI9WC_000566 [Arenicella sp.]|jgi:hypothetical protein
MNLSLLIYSYLVKNFNITKLVNGQLMQIKFQLGNSCLNIDKWATSTYATRLALAIA